MHYQRITRGELHTLIWRQPMKDAAAMIGMSGTRLKKVCTSFAIPTPPNGYWTQPADQRGAVTKLEGRLDQTIQLRIRAAPAELAPVEAERRQWLLDRENDPAFALSVAKTGELHPVAARVSNLLLAAKPDDYGCLSCLTESLPFVRVTPANAPRAVALMDAMARGFEARGFRWQPADGRRWNNSARIMVEGVALKIGIWEHTQQLTREMIELDSAAADATKGQAALAYDYVSTGQLSIRESDFKYYVKDWPRAPLETRLNDLMRALVDAAFKHRDAASRHKEAADARAAEAARLAEIQALKGKQAIAFERIEAAAGQWRRAEDMRTFIAAVALLPLEGAERRLTRDRWVRWASAYADKFDPLKTIDEIIGIDFDTLDRLTALSNPKS